MSVESLGLILALIAVPAIGVICILLLIMATEYTEVSVKWIVPGLLTGALFTWAEVYTKSRAEELGGAFGVVGVVLSIMYLAVMMIVAMGVFAISYFTSRPRPKEEQATTT